ncbi:hypothetical protein [Actinomadura sp. 9N407]|uniref:hypothetical protein n=1 Tax=Actinomadura sp. 9N407 TaxID=3375154 RepID=UPI0037922F2C
MRKLLILAAIGAFAVVGGTTAAYAMPQEAPAGPKTASVQGSAEFRLTFWPDKDVRSFTFDARATPYTRPMPGAPHGLPSDATGTVKVSHYLDSEDKTVRFEAVVDCMTTSPGNAALTAKVVRGDDEVKEWVGKRLGFSVQDAGKDHKGRSQDRVGLSWVVGNAVENDKGEWVEGTVGTCQAPAAFAPVTRGGYTVKHAEMVPAPKG